MSDQIREPPPSPKPRPVRTCCGCFIAVPLLAIVAVLGLYTLNNQTPDIVMPPHAMPADNAYDYFVRASDLARAIKHKSPMSMVNPPTDRKAMFLACRACAQEAAPAMAVLREGLRRPYMSPTMRSSKEISMNLPRNAGFRELARTAGGVAQYRALNHEPDKAVDELLDILELGVVMQRGGALMQSLSAFALESIAVAPLEPLLSDLTPDQLEHVAARLDRIAAERVPFADILEEESYDDTANWLDDLSNTKNLMDSYNGASILVGVQGNLPTPNEGLKIARFMLRNKTAMLKENQKYIHNLALEARKPFTGRSTVPVPDDLLAEMRGDTLLTARKVVVEREAIVAVLRTEVALKRYRAAHGRYPATLQELVPEYLAAVPEDPCAGAANRPLRYRLVDGGKSYLLYSLGSDLVDNGGTPLSYTESGTRGDVVAGKLSPKKPPYWGNK